MRPKTPSLGPGWATHDIRPSGRDHRLPTLDQNPNARQGDKASIVAPVQELQPAPTQPMRRAAVVKNRRFVPPLQEAAPPLQLPQEEPPARRPTGGEWSEWLPSNGYGYRPNYNGVRTKHFPRSNVQETSWDLPPRAVADPRGAREALLEAEEHKVKEFIKPWSSDKMGKPFKPPDGAGASDAKQEQQEQLLDWNDVQAILRKENAAMLAFDILDKDGARDGLAHKVVIWVVDSAGGIAAHKSIEVDEVFGGSNDMSLERTTAKMDDSLRIFGRAVLRKLFNLCIFPVEGVLKGKRELIIVPSGPLCFVPWAALMNRNGHYLAEGHTIRVMPHMSLLHAVHKRARLGAALHAQRPRSDGQCDGGSAYRQGEAGPRCVVIGNPMPIAPRFGKAEERDGELLHAQAEVDEAVSAMHQSGRVANSGSVTTLMEGEATKARVMRSMRDAVWVHVAAHVEESMLLLACDPEAEGAGGDDGVIGCDELVARLRLAPGCTVVLSACNVSTSGPSMFELSKAFMACGASAVLISMWSLVDESTCALMRRVYRGLSQGKHLAEALRFAMLQLAGRKFGEEMDPWDNPATPFSMLPYSRPLHWSGLVVVGSSPQLPGLSPQRLASPRCPVPVAAGDALAPPRVPPRTGLRATTPATLGYQMWKRKDIAQAVAPHPSDGPLAPDAVGAGCGRCRLMLGAASSHSLQME